MTIAIILLLWLWLALEFGTKLGSFIADTDEEGRGQ